MPVAAVPLPTGCAYELCGEDVCYGSLVNFSFLLNSGPWPEDIHSWAWEDPGKGTDSLPEGGSGGEPYGRYWNLGGRELVKIHHPKCPLQDGVLAPLGLDQLPLSHGSTCCSICCCLCPQASPSCHQEHLISKAQLMPFLKAFPSVLTQY